MVTFTTPLIEQITTVFDYVAVLDGDPADLELLAACFTAPDCRVTRQEDRYLLCSTSFRLGESLESVPVQDSDGITQTIKLDATEDAVWDLATNMAIRMVGAAALLRSPVEMVRVTAVGKYTIDGRQVGVQARSRGHYPKKHTIPSERAGLPGLMREWAMTGANDQSVLAVLHAYAQLPASWTRIVLIIEFIAADLGGEKKLSPPLINRGVLRRIRESAQHARNIAEGPRHGSRLPKGWNASRAIELLAADAHIKNLVYRWLCRDKGASGTPC